MSTHSKNLSTYDPDTVPDGSNMTIGVIVSEWNREITSALEQGARETLLIHGVDPKHIITLYVPGSFELPMGGRLLLKSRDPDAVILVGCVIQGETRHFEFICQAVSQGCMSLGQEFSKPVIFGVLTTDNREQALARAGGNLGNKGTEAAITALKMADLARKLG